MNEERMLTSDANEGEVEVEKSLRPQLLSEYIGQEDVTKNLNIYIKAAKQRSEVVDHILLYGPPGLGKTTLASIIANEMGTNMKSVTAPAIDKAGDLAGILTQLNAGDILFIDEIHSIPRNIEEILYSAMEDFYIDIIIGTGDAEKRTIRVDVPPFTLVGATTKAGGISAPLRDRFGIIEHLEFYTTDSLTEIVKRSSDVFGIEITENGAVEIARRSRGTPRIANRLLKRVRDFAQITSDGIVSDSTADDALNSLRVDTEGLDTLDRKILETMILAFKGRPVGIETLCSSIGEERDTLESMYEPYLLQKGFIQRTPRGRIPTDKACEHLEIIKNDN